MFTPMGRRQTPFLVYLLSASHWQWDKKGSMKHNMRDFRPIWHSSFLCDFSTVELHPLAKLKDMYPASCIWENKADGFSLWDRCPHHKTVTKLHAFSALLAKILHKRKIYLAILHASTFIFVNSGICWGEAHPFLFLKLSYSKTIKKTGVKITC